MRRIQKPSYNMNSIPVDCRDSCLRLIRVARDNGWQISPQEAYSIWQEYSSTWAAEWMSFPEDDNVLFQNISHYLR